MKQYQIPVRNNTPQLIGPYTFLDQNGNVIDLSGFISVFLEVKLYGQVYASTGGVILAPSSGGRVQAGPYTFTQIGVYDLQFYCVDGSSNRLYGEPLQITVVPNVDDLALSQLAKY